MVEFLKLIERNSGEISIQKGRERSELQIRTVVGRLAACPVDQRVQRAQA